MTTRPAIGLARWLLSRADGPVTHLKLQKLCFYSYGAALAFGFDREFGGRLCFQAWQHGPVSRDVWFEYRAYRSDPIPPQQPAPLFSLRAIRHLDDVLTVYGRLSAWQLRQQSHLERPWRETFDPQAPREGAIIPTESIRAHFVEKFVEGTTIPEYLGRGSSFSLDGLPVARFDNLHSLAESLRRP